MNRAGLECLEVTPPGKLDASIIESNVRQVDSLFIRTILESSGDSAKVLLQGLIAQVGCSSHFIVIACRSDR
jgi:hypothetical protein